MSKFSKVAAVLIAASFFPNYIEAKEFHITEDGQAFEDLNNATNHARSLSKDEVVITVTREEAENAPIEEPATPIMHIVTAEDLEANPDLVEAGVQVGDEIELGKADETPAEVTADIKKAAAKKKSAKAAK